MSLTYELYWSFRSPYSYLATPRLYRLEQEYDVKAHVRPVLPLAVRAPEILSSRGKAWVDYFRLDIVRMAQFLELPLAWPRPDPVVMDPKTGTYPREQPYIHRLTRLGVAAEEQGRGLAFLYEVSKLLWHPSTDDWRAEGLLAGAAAHAGLNLMELDRLADRDAARFDRAIEENHKAEAEAGHWGAPVMVFQGEPFFGQDRIDVFLWRLKQAGLQKRT